MFKILIVEDEQSIAEMYRFKFEAEGFMVRLAPNGQEGLAAAEAFGPHLILLDLFMPVMSGQEMLARLREKEWGIGMHVIILTNISKNEAPHALRFLHVDRYIIKAHSTPRQVVEIAQETLGSVEHHRESRS